MDNAPFFAAGMIGVVAATYQPVGGAASAVRVQWYDDPSPVADLALNLGGRRVQAKGLTTVFSAARRDDRLTVDGHLYRVMDAHHDGHGITVLDLEP